MKNKKIVIFLEFESKINQAQKSRSIKNEKIINNNVI